MFLYLPLCGDVVLKEITKLDKLQQKVDFIADCFTKAILWEVCTSPKPGLVTRLVNGSHSDMSIFTFMASSAVLARAYRDFACCGLEHKGTLPELLAKLRSSGISYEQQLLAATKGVNTQRGILFIGGLLAGLSGYISAAEDTLSAESLLKLLGEMCGNLTCELKKNGNKSTAGELLYQKYGTTGIRGEVSAGLPAVRMVGLPALKEAIRKGSSLNDCLVHTFLALLAVTDDSNILWRNDMDVLHRVHDMASRVLACGSVFSEAGRAAIADMESFFAKFNISPGGTADLLSVTIALYLLEYKEWPYEIR